MLAFNDFPADRSVMERLFKEKSSEMLKYAFSFTHNEQMAYDAVEYCYYILIDHFDNYRSYSQNSLERYLSRCVRNRCFFLLKSSLRDLPFEEYETDFNNFEDVSFKKIIRDCEIEILHEAIKRLPAHYRTVIELSFYAKKPDNDIGIALDISPASVRMVRTRALRKLASIYFELEEGRLEHES